MNITDLRARVDTLNDRSYLVTRGVEPDGDPVLTLVNTVETNGPEKLDPLLQALVDKLPKPNTVWSINDRGNWLKATALVFNLLYKTGEDEAGFKQKNSSNVSAAG